jgi:hypothetical protein
VDFARRYPALFHVTWREAVDAIRAQGLLSARRLCERHGHDGPDTLTANRTLRVAVGPHVLRRQGMSDTALRPRLDPSITVEAWRSHINGLVFLFAEEAVARRLMASESPEQAILGFRTEHLLDIADVRVCRFNNGYIDRRPLSDPRLRTFNDYQPAAEWKGTPVAEVVVAGAIPPEVAFSVLPSP